MGERSKKLKSIFSICTLCAIFALGRNDARANPLLIPVAAIGTLEAMEAAVAVAAAIGLVSASQDRDFQRSIQYDIDAIKDATAEAVQATVAGAVTLYAKVMRDVNRKNCPQSAPDSRGATCNASVEACCQDFFNKISGKFQRGRGGITIYKSTNKSKVACCAEWDSLHGALEIFDKLGRHLGERGCEDLGDDPCDWTRAHGKHAEPDSSTHQPRTAACQP